MPNSPSRTVDQLRVAVSSGDYSEAERLLTVYRGDVQIRWEACASVAQRAAIAAEVGTLLEWVRTATLAARAHMQRKLIHLTRKKAYAALSEMTVQGPSGI